MSVMLKAADMRQIALAVRSPMVVLDTIMGRIRRCSGEGRFETEIDTINVPGLVQHEQQIISTLQDLGYVVKKRTDMLCINWK